MDVTFLVQIGVALLMGLAIGAERQFGQHPAGLRTNALVCVGAALFVSLSRLMAPTDSPTRIAAQVVCGIGFLGGGVILREGLASPAGTKSLSAVVKGAELHGNLPALLHGIIPAVEKAKKNHPDAKDDALVAAAIKANVWQSIEDLFKKSPLIVKQVQTGKLKIVGAIYDIEDGHVKWLGEHPEQARLLETK
jgi:hypothetical protein